MVEVSKSKSVRVVEVSKSKFINRHSESKNI